MDYINIDWRKKIMVDLLIDFRKLSPPPADVLAKRDQIIEELKKQLGHKYLLSKPVPRVQ